MSASYTRRRLIKQTALATVSIWPSKVLLWNAQAQSVALGMQEFMRKSLLLSESNKLPSFANIEALQKDNYLSMQKKYYAPADVVEHQLRTIGTLAEYAYKIKTVSKESDRKLLISHLCEKAYSNVNYEPFTADVMRGLKEMCFSEDINANADFNSAKNVTAGVLGVLGVGLAPVSVGASLYLTMAAMGTSVLPERNVIFGSKLNTQKFAILLGDLARNYAIEKSQLDPRFASAVKKNGFMINALNLGAEAALPDLLSKSPQCIKPALEKIATAAKTGISLTPAQEEELANRIITKANEQYGKFRESLLIEYQKRESDEAKRREAEKDRQFWQSEIRSALYIAGQIGNRLFKDPKFANKVDAVFTSYNKVTDFMINCAAGTAGIMTGVGTFMSVASLLGSLAKSAKDPVMGTLQEIQKSINTLREEMHLRFDQIIATQKVIINQLDSVLRNIIDGRIEMRQGFAEIRAVADNIDKKVTGIDDLIRTTAYLSEESKLDELIIQARIEADNLKETKKFSVYNVQRVLNGLISYAKHASVLPCFTMNDSPRTWDRDKVIDGFKKMRMLDSGVGLFFGIYHKATGKELSENIAGKYLRGDNALIINPIVLARGMWLYSNTALLFPEAVAMAHKSEQNNLMIMHAEVMDTFAAVLDDKVIASLKEQYLALFKDVVRSVTKTAFANNPTGFTREQIEKDVNLGKIYPFDGPDWAYDKLPGSDTAIGKWKVPQLTTRDWVSNYQTNFAPKNFYPEMELPKGTKIFREGSNAYDPDKPDKPVVYYHTDRDIFELANKYGLITMERMRDHIIMDSLYLGSKNTVGRRTFYKVVILSGQLKESPPQLYYNELVSNDAGIGSGYFVLLAKDYEIIECGLSGDYKVETQNQPVTLKEAPAMAGDLTISSTAQFCQILYGDIKSIMQGNREKVVKAIKVGFLDVSNRGLDELEAIGRSLTFLMGMKCWLNGTSREEATYLSKSPELILGTREAIISAISQILDPSNIDMDKEGRPIYSDKNIDEYVADKLQERLNAEMYKMLNSKLPTKDNGTLELNLALSSMKTVLVEQKGSTLNK